MNSFFSFTQGFTSALPFWLAGAPFALAYVGIAQNAGLNALEIQLMSLIIYSAATQIALIQLSSSGTPILALFFSVITINLHHFLYGLSLTKRIKLSRFGRFLAPFFLTDGVYAITIAAREKSNFAFLLGAEFSLFLAWNLFTALGILLGNNLLDIRNVHLDFAAPLTFFVMLISILKTRRDLAVALLAVGITSLCLAAGLGSLTVILAGVAAPLCGIGISQFQKRQAGIA